MTRQPGQRAFERAASSFKAFCRKWGEKLHQREVHNLAHLVWKLRDGYQTAVYTSYGKIEGCTTKRSTRAVAIGKITYDEIRYYLVGKTIEEAKRSGPVRVGVTHTTELFRWDHGKWQY